MEIDLSTAVRRLHELVEIESPSGDREGSTAITATIARRLTGLGASVESHLVSTGTVLTARIPGSVGRPVLLLAHSDTVWSRGTLSSTVPWREFSTPEGESAVAGPGAFDMKSGIVVIEEALSLVAELPHRPVIVFVASDEEIGSADSTPLLTPLLPSVGAVIAFESPHPDGALKVGRRGSTRLRLVCDGVEAHAALDPDKGVSAIDELVDQLVDIRRVVESERGHDPHAVLLNVGTISGGTRANVVPAHAEALLGLRFADADAERRILDLLTTRHPHRPRAGVRVEVASHRPVWMSSPDDMRLAAALGLEGRPAAGAGDSNTTGSLGVPTVDGFGPRGGGAHAATEHVIVSSIADRVQRLAAWLTLASPAR